MSDMSETRLRFPRPDISGIPYNPNARSHPLGRVGYVRALNSGSIMGGVGETRYVDRGCKKFSRDCRCEYVIDGCEQPTGLKRVHIDRSKEIRLISEIETFVSTFPPYSVDP